MNKLRTLRKDMNMRQLTTEDKVITIVICLLVGFLMGVRG